jgi:amino acid permease
MTPNDRYTQSRRAGDDRAIGFIEDRSLSHSPARRSIASAGPAVGVHGGAVVVSLPAQPPSFATADQPLVERPHEAIAASALAVWTRLWVWLAGWAERLPPFWIAFALTLTETIGAGILALPIAVAGIGPLAAVALLLLLGLVNILTITAVSEAVVRSGGVRSGSAYFGRMVAEYLGGAGALVLTMTLLVLIVLNLVSYYIGVADTLASATGISAVLWAGLLFVITLCLLRRETINATITSALLIGALNIGLILTIALIVLPHVRAANLRYLQLPFVAGQPFDPAMLSLVFGVGLAVYFGHTSVGNCARVVLRRDPSGRALIRGNAAAIGTVMVLICIWVVAVNGAVAPAALIGQRGTALVPLARQVGATVYLPGAIFAILSMGMASVHYALALFNQVREWLPTQPPASGGLIGQLRALAASRCGRFWLGIAPVAATVLLTEWLLLTGKGSFAGTVGFLWAITLPLLGGLFPMLLLAASRRAGDYVPGRVSGWLGHPIVIVGAYLFFLASLVVHGLVIWQDPIQRAAALITSMVMVVMTAICWRSGAFAARAVVELRVDVGGGAVVSVVASGAALAADMVLRDDGGVRRLRTALAATDNHALLRSASIQLPATRARRLKVWTHRVTPAGDSELLAARLEFDQNGETCIYDMGRCGGQLLLPLEGQPCRLVLTL